MNDKTLIKKKLAQKIALVSLLILLIIICIIIIAIVTANGKLAIAMIVALVFTSILYWIGLSFYKKMMTKTEN